MDAITLLKADHRSVSDLLKELSKTTEKSIKQRRELLPLLAEKLKCHEKMEEEVFYPTLHKNAKTKSMVLEAYEEHSLIDRIINELKDVPVDEDIWKAKFSVLKENIEHHVAEEESDLFPKVKQVLNNKTLDELGKQMLTIKDKTM